MKGYQKILLGLFITLILAMVVTTSASCATGKSKKPHTKCSWKGYKPSPQRNKTFKGRKTKKSKRAKKETQIGLKTPKAQPTANGFNFDTVNSLLYLQN